MYNRCRMAVISLLAGALMAVIPVSFAQSPDPTLIKTVADALTKTQTATSLHRESQSLTAISGLPQNMNIGQKSMESFDIVRVNNNLQAEGTRTLQMTLATGETVLNAEYVLVDGISYVRFTDVPDEMADTLPTVWTETAATSDASQANADQANPDPMAGGLLSIEPETLLSDLSLPVTAESVTAITPLADAEINGEAMKVYQITLDPAAVLDSDAAGLLNIGFGGAGGAGGFGGPPNGQLPEGMPAITPPAQMTTPAEITPPSPEDFQMTFAVYINGEGFASRIYSVIASTVSISSPMGEMPISFTLTTQTDYTQFNVPVEIAMPELGS